MATRRRSDSGRSVEVHAGTTGWIARFSAFAGPCEIHFPGLLKSHAREYAQLGAEEAWRIQDKYSRFLEHSWTGRLNRLAGHQVDLDDETSALLQLADTACNLSEGAFDLTAGALRRIWSFAEGAEPPSEAEIRECLQHVGWRRVRWDSAAGWIRLPVGMELDLGGIGKEYAVDRVTQKMLEKDVACTLVNFGGDLFASAPLPDGKPWVVALDNPECSGSEEGTRIELFRGALATSGDARQGFSWHGVRYGHLLDARTGWPPAQAPRSVTVLADTCSEAGLLASLAMLKGSGAKGFLDDQGRQAWILASG